MSEKDRKVKEFAILAFLDDGKCYQILLKKDKRELLNRLLKKCEQPLQLIGEPLNLSLK